MVEAASTLLISLRMFTIIVYFMREIFGVYFSWGDSFWEAGFHGWHFSEEWVSLASIFQEEIFIEIKFSRGYVPGQICVGDFPRDNFSKTALVLFLN